MDRYDYIIIGAGMGGLSTANFLAMFGKKVLIVEKHDIPGGFVTSFKRKGIKFNLGIESLHELGPNDTIQQFFGFWGAQIPSVKISGDMLYYIGTNEYLLKKDCFELSLIGCFDKNSDDVRNILRLNKAIYDEMHSGDSAPIPPYEMSLLQKITFALSKAKSSPNFMKYGMKDFNKVINKLTDNEELKSVIFAKAMSKMVYMGYAYMWEVSRRNERYYPASGMQTIPDTAAKLLKEHGGELLLNTEASQIIIDNNKAVAIKCKNGQSFFAEHIIANCSPHHMLNLLPNKLYSKQKLQRTISKRPVFQSCSIMFIGVKSSYDFGDIGIINILDSETVSTDPASFNENNCPISLMIQPKEDENYAVCALSPIPYEYEDCWHARNGRGSEYRALKQRVQNTLMSRICEKLGNGFKESVIFSELSTPITYERYTYSTYGSFMGWAIDEKNYGKFLKQHTDTENLHMVGQWVFPGFGVAGVMASGYFLSKDLLKQDGIDLEQEFKKYTTDI